MRSPRPRLLTAFALRIGAGVFALALLAVAGVPWWADLIAAMAVMVLTAVACRKVVRRAIAGVGGEMHPADVPVDLMSWLQRVRDALSMSSACAGRLTRSAADSRCCWIPCRIW